MAQTQLPKQQDARFVLRSERLGPLPLINHFIERIGLEGLLDHHVPTRDRRCAVTHTKALGVLLRSLIVEREPLYRQQETAVSFAPALFGLGSGQIGHSWGMIASGAPWIGCSMPTGRRC